MTPAVACPRWSRLRHALHGSTRAPRYSSLLTSLPRCRRRTPPRRKKEKLSQSSHAANPNESEAEAATTWPCAGTAAAMTESSPSPRGLPPHPR
ncbi:hypothetical protein DAI22_10g048300 [Oryza sativa Japonica Group]|nr:hypothetical protein DAI22_10g048300 [Oryza sativa Japonica Group]